MTLETLLIITVVVAAIGTVSTQLFRGSSSPYLITLRGTKLQLIAAGALIWIGAVALGLVALFIVASFLSNVVAIALFFGVEAVALDICAHRIRYERIAERRGGPIQVIAARRH
jgi:hypothetical protein